MQDFLTLITGLPLHERRPGLMLFTSTWCWAYFEEATVHTGSY